MFESFLNYFTLNPKYNQLRKSISKECEITVNYKDNHIIIRRKWDNGGWAVGNLHLDKGSWCITIQQYKPNWKNKYIIPETSSYCYVNFEDTIREIRRHCDTY